MLLVAVLQRHLLPHLLLMLWRMLVASRGGWVLLGALGRGWACTSDLAALQGSHGREGSQGCITAPGLGQLEPLLCDCQAALKQSCTGLLGVTRSAWKKVIRKGVKGAREDGWRVEGLREELEMSKDAEKDRNGQAAWRIQAQYNQCEKGQQCR